MEDTITIIIVVMIHFTLLLLINQKQWKCQKFQQKIKIISLLIESDKIIIITMTKMIIMSKAKYINSGKKQKEK